MLRKAALADRHWHADLATWSLLLAITLSKFIVVEAYKVMRGRGLAERLYGHGSVALGAAGHDEIS